MNRLFFLGLIVYLSASAYADVKLENLCSGSIFKHQNVIEVNSVHRIMMNTTLSDVGFYAIEEELDFSNWFKNKTNADKLEELKQEYNDIIVKTYSEQFFNSNFQFVNIFKSRIATIKNETEKLREEALEQHKYQFTALTQAFERGVSLIDKFLLYKNNLLNPSYFSLETFKNILSRMDYNETEKTFVFKDYTPFQMYKRPIEKLERFYFIKYSPSFYDFRSTGKLLYSINLPFNNRNNMQQGAPCIEGKDLPPFFSQKHAT